MKTLSEQEEKRLNINISTKTHLKIKALTAIRGISIKEYIVSLISKDLEKQPNKDTLKAFEEAKTGEVDRFKNAKELFKALEI